MSDEIPATITIRFKPNSIRVGDYFPAEFEAVETMVALDVPFKEEFFHNYSDLVRTKQYIQPDLTIPGFRWCYNQLRSIFVTDLSEEFGKDNETDLTDEEWK